MPLELVIFDMDGVITDTATVHAFAWKKIFDRFLRIWASDNNLDFKEFSIDSDYLTFVDGNPRYIGVQNFMDSRGIDLPYGKESDKGYISICGVGNQKDDYFVKAIEENGVVVFEDAISLIKEIYSIGKVKMAVASSSKNCKLLLKKSEIIKYFDLIYDGVTIKELDLCGKPDPDLFLAIMHELCIEPHSTAVIEDAISGVKSAVAAGVGITVGLDRADQGLGKYGADIVVKDLKSLTLEKINKLFG